MVRHFHYIQWGGSYLSRWSNTHSSDWGGSWGWYGHNLSLPITDNILLLLQILSDMLRHNLGFDHGLNLLIIIYFYILGDGIVAIDLIFF